MKQRTLMKLGLVVVTVAAILGGAVAWTHHAGAAEGELTFTDVKKQTMEFIRYEQEHELTAEQEAIKKAALTAIPAPCCSDNTAYTCCCPCNMSLSIWGLSKYLIREHDYDAEALKAKVEEWIETIGPDGFSGNVCYTGGCARPFAKNGCGGMRPGHVTWEN